MANGEDMTQPTLHKKGASGKYYAKTLDLTACYSKQGYKVKVGSKADKESDSLQIVNKLQVATAQFPNNIPLQTIKKQKTLDWLQLTPEENKEVMDFDDQQPPPLMPANGQKMPLAPPNRMNQPMPQPQPIAA